MAVNTSDSLEMLINSLRSMNGVTAHDVGTPNFAEVYAAIITRLSGEEIPYALTGAMAYGLYAPARATANIDILAMREASPRINAIAGQLGLLSTHPDKDRSVFVEPRSGVEINLWVGAGEPFRSAVADPAHHKIFGLVTPVIKPEYLVWLYCLFDHSRRFDKVIELINAGNVDLALLKVYLSRAEDTATLLQLEAAVLAAEQCRHSSYSASMERRMARLKSASTD